MPPRLPLHTKLFFGTGQLAEGMMNTAFNAFLLLFYSQILGLPAWLGGLALGIALAVDAVTDPMTGSLSDALHHRWGRRHPFMYAAAIPLWITFALTFRPPPELGNLALFGWMLGLTILARLAMTLYHVPHLALGAELTSDYEERTSVVAFRNFCGLMGGVAVFVIARQLFLAPTEAYPNGQLNPGGYPGLGAFFGLAMALAILASALGTHSRIPTLPVAGDVERFSFRRMARELGEALSNDSFRPLFLGVLIFFVARGVAISLDLYMGTFFWKLPTRQVLLIPVAGAIGIALGTIFWSFASRGREKKHVFVLCVIWFGTLTFLLPVLKIVGFYPPFESPLYAGLIFAFVFTAAFGAAGSLLTAGSMMADIADEHELDVGRRQEGIFFGALSFSGKAAVGAGSAIAGVALTLIEFPRQVAPDVVPPETVLALAIIAGPAISVLMLIGSLLMFRYGLTRERVAEIQRALAERRTPTHPSRSSMDSSDAPVAQPAARG
ncbi:MAG: MFS transporter [Myxococcota bacterium]